MILIKENITVLMAKHENTYGFFWNTRVFDSKKKNLDHQCQNSVNTVCQCLCLVSKYPRYIQQRTNTRFFVRFFADFLS